MEEVKATSEGDAGSAEEDSTLMLNWLRQEVKETPSFGIFDGPEAVFLEGRGRDDGFNRAKRVTLDLPAFATRKDVRGVDEDPRA